MGPSFKNEQAELDWKAVTWSTYVCVSHLSGTEYLPHQFTKLHYVTLFLVIGKCYSKALSGLKKQEWVSRDCYCQHRVKNLTQCFRFPAFTPIKHWTHCSNEKNYEWRNSFQCLSSVQLCMYLPFPGFDANCFSAAMQELIWKKKKYFELLKIKLKGPSLEFKTGSLH